MSQHMSQQINLFNPAFEPQRNLLSANKMAAALGVLALGLALAGGVAQLRVAHLQADAQASAQRLEQAQARLAKATVEFAPRKSDPALQAQLAQALAHLAALQRAQGILDSGALGNTEGYADYFKALARQGVQGLWLTGVSIGGAGTDLGVRGRALDASLVPGYIGRLGNEGVMRGKTIGNLVIDQGAMHDPNAKDAKDGQGAAQNVALPPFVEFQFQSAPVAADKDKEAKR